jgi:hypothetical protein
MNLKVYYTYKGLAWTPIQLLLHHYYQHNFIVNSSLKMKINLQHFFKHNLNSILIYSLQIHIFR